MYGCIKSIASRSLLANVFDHIGRRFVRQHKKQTYDCNSRLLLFSKAGLRGVTDTFPLKSQHFECVQIVVDFVFVSFGLTFKQLWTRPDSFLLRNVYAAFRDDRMLSNTIQHGTGLSSSRSFNYAFQICTPNAKAHNCYGPAPSSTRIDAQTVKCRFHIFFVITYVDFVVRTTTRSQRAVSEPKCIHDAISNDMAALALANLKVRLMLRACRHCLVLFQVISATGCIPPTHNTQLIHWKKSAQRQRKQSTKMQARHWNR